MTSSPDDTAGPRDGAAAGNASPESLASVPSAQVEWERAAGAVRAARAAEDRFAAGYMAADFMVASVRRVIAAWVAAIGGDERELAAMARPEAIQALLHPRHSGADAERTQVVVGGLRVRGITFRRIDADAVPPAVRIWFEYSGRRYIEGVDPASPGSGHRDTEDRFADDWTLTLDGPAPWPWRLADGFTWRLFSFLGYDFVSRRETPEEYRKRTSEETARPDSARPGRCFEIRADFAEHDERISGAVMTVVERETRPTREDADELISPAIQAEVIRRLGPGDWLPSLNYLEVRELLGEPPASAQPGP